LDLLTTPRQKHRAVGTRQHSGQRRSHYFFRRIETLLTEESSEQAEGRVERLASYLLDAWQNVQ
jgi:hypothetical protein